MSLSVLLCLHVFGSLKELGIQFIPKFVGLPHLYWLLKPRYPFQDNLLGCISVDWNKQSPYLLVIPVKIGKQNCQKSNYYLHQYWIIVYRFIVELLVSHPFSCSSAAMLVILMMKMQILAYVLLCRYHSVHELSGYICWIN